MLKLRFQALKLCIKQKKNVNLKRSFKIKKTATKYVTAE